MKKFQIIIVFLLCSVSAGMLAQVTIASESYGFRPWDRKIDYATWVRPGSLTGTRYLLSGVDNLRIRVPGVAVKSEPPQCNVFALGPNGIFPVWEWVHEGAAANFEADSGKDFQQWEFGWSPEMGQFFCLFDPQNGGTDNHHLVFLDAGFHLRNRMEAFVPDMHEAKLEVSGADTLAYLLDYRPYGYAVELRRFNALGGADRVWSFERPVSDTVQTQNREGSCFGLPVGDPGEYFHPNSVDAVRFGDTLLIGVSERHTSLIRITAVTPGDTFEHERIGGYGHPYGTAAVPPGFRMDAQHDFRFVERSGDSVLCSVFSDGVSCGDPDSQTTAEGVVFWYHPLSHKISSFKTVGFGLVTTAMGSFRYSPDDSVGVVCHGIGRGRETPGSTVPQGFWPLERGGQISVTQGDSLVAALSYTNVLNWGSKVTVGAPYRATLVNELPIRQPEITGTLAGGVLSLSTDLIGPIWNTGDTAAVLGPATDGFYIVRGKTDPAMVGSVYSKPVWVYDNGAHSSPKEAGTGIPSLEGEGVETYPNPTTGRVWLTSPTPPAEVEVYSVTGQRVPVASGGSHFDFPGEAENGVYFVKVKDGRPRKVVLLR